MMKPLLYAVVLFALAHATTVPVLAEGGDQTAVEKQVALLTSALEKTPQDRFLYDERARLNFDLGQFQKVIEDCNKALEIEAEDLRAYHLRSIAYKSLGKNDESKADEEKLVALADQLGQRNANKELDRATTKIKANPKDSKAYSDRAAIYFDLKNYSASIKDCGQAISLNAKNKAAYFTRMGALLAEHHDSEAKLDRAKFDKLNSTDVTAFSKSAVSDYSHSLILNPKDTSALEHRAQAYIDVGSYKEALSDLNKLIELKPDYGLAYRMRAACFEKLKDETRAGADLKTAQKLK